MTEEQPNLTLLLSFNKIEALKKEIAKRDKKIAKLRDCLCESITLLMTIRYRNWPKTVGNFLPDAEVFDEVIHNADKLIPTRVFKKKHTEKPELLR